MILPVVGLALGVLLGVLSGGRTMRLARVTLRGEFLVLALFVIQGLARGRLTGSHPSVWGVSIWACSSLALVAVLTVNWRQPGLSVASAGILFNLFVVLANGFMPISLASGRVTGSLVASTAGFYRFSSVGTLTPWIGDVLPLSLPGETLVLSIGDVLLETGIIVFVLGTMVATGIAGIDDATCQLGSD
jgi:hypothetical protein